MGVLERAKRNGVDAGMSINDLNNLKSKLWYQVARYDSKTTVEQAVTLGKAWQLANYFHLR